MAGATTEHAQVVVKAALSFLRGQLSVFAKLVGDGCGVSRGGLRFVGLLVFVKLVVLVAVVGFVTARSLIFLSSDLLPLLSGLMSLLLDLFFPAWDFSWRRSQCRESM